MSSTNGHISPVLLLEPLTDSKSILGHKLFTNAPAVHEFVFAKLGVSDFELHPAIVGSSKQVPELLSGRFDALPRTSQGVDQNKDGWRPRPTLKSFRC